MSRLFDQINAYTDLISPDYSRELDKILGEEDKGCIKSTVILTEVISRRFSIPIGYNSPGIRIKYGVKDGKADHYWSEVCVDDHAFLDGRYGQFDECWENRIRFDAMEPNFYIVNGLSVPDDRELRKFHKDLEQIDDADTEFAFLITSQYPSSSKFMLDINDSGTTEHYLEKNPDLRRFVNMFLGY